MVQLSELMIQLHFVVSGVQYGQDEYDGDEVWFGGLVEKDGR